MLSEKKSGGIRDAHGKPSFFRRLLQKKEHGISLNEYLRVCGICYRAAFPDLEGKPGLELYRAFSDGRHGGMLEIKHRRSTRAFEKWLASDEWQGSHPFEILRGIDELGIHLVPPMGGKPFQLTLGSTHWARHYLAMARALEKSGIAFEARDLKLAGKTRY